MNLAQILAVVIFLVMFGLIISEKIERHIITLAAGLLTILAVFVLAMGSTEAIKETLNLHSIFTLGFWYTGGRLEASSTGINWETIIFIAGMMVMVEGMAKAGFFRWLCIKLAKLVNYKPVAIFIAFMFMAAILSMFIDSITVILFLASATIELARILKFNPVPVIMSEIFCANLGGSSTMCGDPPNIIIGTSFGYSFGDFLRNTGSIAFVCLIVIVIYFYIVFKKQLSNGEKPDLEAMEKDSADLIPDKKAFALSSAIFGLAVVLLISHAKTGLTVSTIGVVIAVLMLIASGKHAVDILKLVDYKTLLFFVGLFIVVGGLEQTGVLTLIAGLIGSVSGGNVYIMVAIVLWLSAIASALVDNIPFAATMVPVIRSLSATMGVDLHTLAWTLAMGTDIGGSATPIGASANVVGIAVAKKEGFSIGWGKYCKYLIPATVLVILITMLMLFAKYC